jgi:hypothetical protein
MTARILRRCDLPEPKNPEIHAPLEAEPLSSYSSKKS